MKQLIVLVLLLSCMPDAQAIYKCSNAEGKISYQRNPCNPTDNQRRPRIKDRTAQKINLDGPGYKKARLQLSLSETLELPVPGSWSTQLGGGHTLRATSEQGELFLLSVLPRVADKDKSHEAVLRQLRDLMEYTNMEKFKSRLVTSGPLNPALMSGRGYIYKFEDLKLKGVADLPEGEYRFNSSSSIVLDSYIVSVTVLANEENAEIFDISEAALRMVTIN